MMKETVKSMIRDFVLNDKSGSFDFLNGGRAFDEPVVRFASADDPLFLEYKNIIGEKHITPREIFELEFGENSYHGGSVICVVLPLSENIKKTQRTQNDWPSKEWTLNRTLGDGDYKEVIFRDFVIHLMNEKGYKCIAPGYSRHFKVFPSPTDIISSWSERHAAYAAGLGTFSLNDAFISERGIAIRLISFVTDCVIAPDERTAENHYANCLYLSNGSCGACIKRCPVGAITEKGHVKQTCFMRTYGEESKQIAVSRGAKESAGSGCGLCQVGTPCENKNPMRKGL
jgi:epoxyqueuosine reductase QueG